MCTFAAIGIFSFYTVYAGSMSESEIENLFSRVCFICDQHIKIGADQPRGVKCSHGYAFHKDCFELCNHSESEKCIVVTLMSMTPEEREVYLESLHNYQE